MKNANYPYNPHTPVATLRELLDLCVNAYGDKPAFRFQEKKAEVAISYLQFREEVSALCTQLLSLGLGGSHIAILGENSYSWILVYFAAACVGAVAVPIDRDLPVEEICPLLSAGDCKAIFVSQSYTDISDELSVRMPDLSVFRMNDVPGMVQNGRRMIDEGSSLFTKTQVSENQLSSIVFTSGTTGNPKGVMLTHRNICSCVYGAASHVLVTGPSLLVLPLHHAFGLVISVFAVMYCGFPVCINRSLKRLSDDFKRYQPEHLFAVPLIVETLYKNIWNAARKSKKEKTLKRLIKLSDCLLACGIDLRQKLFRTVLDGFGGKLDLIVSGGAPLDDKYVRAFRSFGITVLNGYGITECGPVVAVNRNRFIVPDSVGLPLHCNRVRISAEGEIQVSGDNVTPGYYHNETENDKAFTEDGWFRTGDLGYLDEQGSLHITGRIKNLIILSNGENVPAEAIEREVYMIPYVKEVVAFGRNDRICIEAYLEEDSGKTAADLLADVQILNQRLPMNRNIGDVVTRDIPFPKTTTKKIKRDYGGKANAGKAD